MMISLGGTENSNAKDATHGRTSQRPAACNLLSAKSSGDGTKNLQREIGSDKADVMFQHRFTFLLITLIVLLLAIPLTQSPGLRGPRSRSRLLFFGVLMSSVYAVSDRRSHLDCRGACWRSLPAAVLRGA